MIRALLLGLLLPLAACTAGAPETDASAPAQPAPAATPAPVAAPPVSEPATPKDVPSDATGGSMAAGEVDYSCKVDADCAVKDIGNCCGYYPACVNTASPTFPEKVKADCAAKDMQSICGFPEISSCQCVEGRCAASGGATGQIQ